MFLVMRICWVLGVWVGGFSQGFGRRWRIVADFDRTADGPNGEVCGKNGDVKSITHISVGNIFFK